MFKLENVHFFLLRKVRPIDTNQSCCFVMAEADITRSGKLISVFRCKYCGLTFNKGDSLIGHKKEEHMKEIIAHRKEQLLGREKGDKIKDQIRESVKSINSSPPNERYVLL